LRRSTGKISLSNRLASCGGLFSSVFHPFQFKDRLASFMPRYSKVIKKRKKAGPSFLPEWMQVFLARRFIDAAGLLMLGSGVLFLAALLSYSHTDPSWNTATTGSGAAVQNWVGLPGAYLSDLFMQTLGFGAVVLGFVLAIWGARVLRRQAIRPLWARFATMIVAMLLISIALALAPSGSLLVHPYLGGSGGTILLDRMTAALRIMIPSSTHGTVALFAAIAGLAALLHACAIGMAELKALCSRLRQIAVSAALFCAAKVMDFYDWVRIYGDPDYEAPPRRAAARSRQPRTPKVKKERAPRTAPRLSADNEEAGDEGWFGAPVNGSNGLAVPIKVVAAERKPQAASRQSNFTLNESGEWELPPADLLQEAPEEDLTGKLDETALRQNAEMLHGVLNDFNVSGDIVSIHPGPVVTLYELEPAPGTKSSRVIGLSDDIARSMAAVSVRCSNIPGRNVIGIELPNSQRQTVYMRELLETKDVAKTKAALPLILGKEIGGKPVIADLAKMPHLLIAGTTGSGKSVAVNTMILSLLYQLPPERCRFIMIDPKMLELSVYDDIPHLLSPVVTEPGKAIVSLKWAVQEMENRYRAMSRLGVRNIEGYNDRLAQARKKGETLMRKVQTGFDPESGKPVFEDQPMDMTALPYIVIVVDEFADLMLVAGKDVENAVQRLAQMARAAGIHLIMATQRPSVDVITGVIKANFPTRISFQVTSKIDSRTILGEGGAEQLLGMGDMLYMASGGRITRVHGPFVSDDEVESVVGFLKSQGAPAYLEEITEGGDFGDSEIMAAMFGGEGGSGDGAGVDELYDQAVAIVARERKASTSFIQRHLQIGYNRAARIIEEMERQGVITKASPTGKRDVLVGDYSDA